MITAVVLSHELVVEHIWAIASLRGPYGCVPSLIVVTFVLNVECLVSTLDIYLLHVLESLVHKYIFDVLHISIAGPKHNLFSNFWILFEDLTSEEPLA